MITFSKNFFSISGIVVLLISLTIIGCILNSDNVREGFASIESDCSGAYVPYNSNIPVSDWRKACTIVNNMDGVNCTSDLSGNICTNIGMNIDITQKFVEWAISQEAKEKGLSYTKVEFPKFTPPGNTFFITNSTDACKLGATYFKGAPINCQTT
jgi:hypothetical protein